MDPTTESNHNIVLLFERVGPCQAIAELQVGKSVHVHDSATMASTHPSIQIRVAILPNRSRTHRQAGATEDRDVHEPTPESLKPDVPAVPDQWCWVRSFHTDVCPCQARFEGEDPDVVCIFFTTMPVLHVLYQERFITYHISGRKRLDGFEAREWNTIVEEMLRIVIEAHNPTTFVFDGAFPYRGMLEAIGDYGNLRKIWVRRGTMKARSSIPVDSEDFFERIVVPGDVEDGEPTETGGELRVPPMLLLNPDESLGRIQARRTLGLAIESKCVYVQLGAGNINDIDHDLGEVVHELLQRSECQIVIGESMLGARIPVDHERVRVLRDYPNSRFLQAFDAAVQAGGYNSFHEMRVAGIPTLFLLNAQTGMDDQERRCMTSIDEGWGVVRKRNDSRTMRQLIDEMFDLNRPSVRDIKNGSDVLAIELLRGD